MNLGIVPKGVGNDPKNKVGKSNHQSHEETDGGFASVRGDAKRHANEGKSEARKRGRKTLVQFRAAGAALAFVRAL